MPQVNNVVNFNVVANVTKFLHRSLYLILSAALASAALLYAHPAHAQEGPAPAPALAPAPADAQPVTPQPDGSHLVPEGVKESTPAPAEDGGKEKEVGSGKRGRGKDGIQGG